MLIILFCAVVSAFIVLLLKLVSSLICEATVLSRQELSPYECGFEHTGSSRVPFSLRYFFLTLLFLLFDLEIVLLLFMPMLSISLRVLSCVSFGLCFISFLLLGLLYEYLDGTLEWLK